jgi:hypothetical protein
MLRTRNKVPESGNYKETPSVSGRCVPRVSDLRCAPYVLPLLCHNFRTIGPRVSGCRVSCVRLLCYTCPAVVSRVSGCCAVLFRLLYHMLPAAVLCVGSCRNIGASNQGGAIFRLIPKLTPPPTPAHPHPCTTDIFHHGCQSLYTIQ